MKNSFHILLVEDDPDDVELLQTAFDDNDTSCIIDNIMQGDEIIPHLSESQSFPDVLILDLNLPKLHGKEILKLLKSHVTFHKIPVVVLTTSSSKTDIEFCLKAGAEDFITKPTNSNGFSKAVEIIKKIALKYRVESLS